MINRNDLFPIGIGTWGIGGFAERNPKNDDDKQRNALVYMFEQGMNYVEVNLWTAEGHSARLVKEALEKSSKNRSDIFISQAIYEYKNPTLEDAKQELKQVLKLFDTNYIDSLEFNVSAFERYGYDQLASWIQEILDKGLIRYTALSNPDKSYLEKYYDDFRDKLFSIEVGYNFEIRESVKLGIIPYAQLNDILVVVFQPLRRNRTAKRNWPLLVDLSKKYGVSQNQIIMNWIVSRGYLPLTKSETISHIDEHIASLKVKLEMEDKKRLDEFKQPGYKSPQIHWGKGSKSVRIDQLSNVFDEEYDKQKNKAE